MVRPLPFAPDTNNWYRRYFFPFFVLSFVQNFSAESCLFFSCFCFSSFLSFVHPDTYARTRTYREIYVYLYIRMYVANFTGPFYHSMIKSVRTVEATMITACCDKHTIIVHESIVYVQWNERCLRKTVLSLMVNEKRDDEKRLCKDHNEERITTWMNILFEWQRGIWQIYIR